MKTIVVFEAPGSAWYCDLADLATTPVKGSGYIYAGARYQVIEVVESLGVHRADGGKRTGSEKLVEIVGCLHDLKSARVLANMTNIGSGAKNSGVTAGGIQLPSTSAVSDDFDNVIYVRLKRERSGKQADTSLVALAGLTGLGLFARAPACDGPAQIGPIRLRTGKRGQKRRTGEENVT